jgi:hypothetical protein
LQVRGQLRFQLWRLGCFVTKFTDACGSDDPFEPNNVKNPSLNSTPYLPFPNSTPESIEAKLAPEASDTIDYYALTVPLVSKAVTLSLFQPAGADYILKLLNENGSVIATGGINDTINNRHLSEGIYYITVSTTNMSSAFSNVCYTLRAETGTSDEDGDGYTVAQNDCDDSNPAVHPGVPEICNALDDNCNGTTDEPVPVYTYTDNTTGIPQFVLPNSTGTNFALVNGALAASTACPTGYNTKNFPSTTLFSLTQPAIEFTLTPNSGYQVQATSLSADLRRSGTGPALVRFAYSIDGGSTWVDQGSNLSLNNSNCGLTTSFTWNFPDFITTQSIKVRIYPFNASATGGFFQMLNVKFNGTGMRICG